MIEFKPDGNSAINIYVNDSYCMFLYKFGLQPWVSEFLMECSEEQMTAQDHRAIAEKLDELNKGDV